MIKSLYRKEKIKDFLNNNNFQVHLVIFDVTTIMIYKGLTGNYIILHKPFKCSLNLIKNLNCLIIILKIYFFRDIYRNHIIISK
jgi:hypothetical protein